MKLDTAGNIQWQKSLGGTQDDIAYSIDQTVDNGYIVAGYSYSTDGEITNNHGNTDYWIVKLDDSGNIQWQKSLGGTQNEYAQSIHQTNDKGFIVAGRSYSRNGDVTGHHDDVSSSDYWVVKLDSVGNLQWEKSLGGTNDDAAYSVQQTLDKGYIVGGLSFSDNKDVTGHHGTAGSDYWVVKLDSVGAIQWQKSLGGYGNDFGKYAEQTSASEYIICGEGGINGGDITGNHGGYDYWIVFLDATGNIRWQESLGGSDLDGALSVRQTVDAGYIIVGSSLSFDGDVSGHHDFNDNNDYWVVKLAPDILPVTWLNFDGVLHNNEALLSWSTATELNNKGFEVQKSTDGRTFNDIGFVNGHGNSTSLNHYNFTDIKVANGSNYYRLKQIDNDGRMDYSSVITLDYSKFEWSVSGSAETNNSWIQLYLDKSSNISIQIISVTGNIIQTINKGNLSEGTFSIPFSLNNKARGIYLVKLMVDSKMYSKKIIR